MAAVSTSIQVRAVAAREPPGDIDVFTNFPSPQSETETVQAAFST
jgi:hypothetical protein